MYLGTTFNYNGRFKKASSKQISQANRAIHGLLCKAKVLCLPVDIQCTMFSQMITPILLYGCEVWEFALQVFHRKFLKNVLKLNKRTASCMIYGESGSMDLSVNVEKRMINFCLRLCTGSQSKLSVTMYKFMKILHDSHDDFKPKWIYM